MYSNKLPCIANLLSYLENPQYPSVGPHLYLLGLTGLWHPIRNKKATLKIYLFYVTVTFFCSQYVRCLIKLDVDSLTLILQYAPFHMGIVKSCFFQTHYKKWEDVIFFVSSLERDQLSRKNEQRVEITKYIKRGRGVTYFFWALAFLSNISIFSEPYRLNQANENGTKIYSKVFDGYTPYSNEPPGYYISMLVQTLLGYVLSAYVVAWDTLVVTIMIFFAGQLKVMRMSCEKIITSGNDAESHQNIVHCHQHHIKLIKEKYIVQSVNRLWDFDDDGDMYKIFRYQQLFNELISPVMFVYLIVISVNLGVCVIEIAQLQDDVATLMSSGLFVMACLIQLLLFYWHANEVTAESILVSYSTFESNWTSSPVSVQKEVALLGLTTTKKMVFKAGPFNEMSLHTFVAILRASYSFYTLLSKTN